MVTTRQVAVHLDHATVFCYQGSLHVLCHSCYRQALWKFVHADGDFEDLELEEVERALHAYKHRLSSPAEGFFDDGGDFVEKAPCSACNGSHAAHTCGIRGHMKRISPPSRMPPTPPEPKKKEAVRASSKAPTAPAPNLAPAPVPNLALSSLSRTQQSYIGRHFMDEGQEWVVHSITAGSFTSVGDGKEHTDYFVYYYALADWDPSQGPFPEEDEEYLQFTPLAEFESFAMWLESGWK